MADELCPTCHSKIGTDSTSDVGRLQGNEGVDDLGNPVPRWSDDPVFTSLGLSGSTYAQKQTRARKKHIKELQETRIVQESESDVQATDFSDIETDEHISRRHIIELRESTEKLLDANGLTLEDYFKLDDEGTEQPQNPNIVRAGGTSPQDEWVDVERGEEYVSKDGSLASTFVLPDGSVEQSPTLPKRTHIRGIHIEDLRHPISVGLSSFLVRVDDRRIFTGRKKGPANFTDVEECP